MAKHLSEDEVTLVVNAKADKAQQNIRKFSKEIDPSLTGIIIFHKFSVCFEGFRFAKYLIISRSVF